MYTRSWERVLRSDVDPGLRDTYQYGNARTVFTNARMTTPSCTIMYHIPA